MSAFPATFFPGDGFNFSSERVLKILKQTRPCFRGGSPSTRGWTVQFPRFRLQLCVGSVAVWPYVGVTQMTQRKLKAWKGMAGVCKNHELRRAFWWFKNLALDSEAHPVRSTGAVATGTRGSLGRNGEGDKEATWMEKKQQGSNGGMHLYLILHLHCLILQKYTIWIMRYNDYIIYLYIYTISYYMIDSEIWWMADHQQTAKKGGDVFFFLHSHRPIWNHQPVVWGIFGSSTLDSRRFS